MSTLVRISYDARGDLLVAAAPDVLTEGLPKDGLSEPLDGLFIHRRSRRGRPLGFTVFDAFDWDVLSNESTPEVWGGSGCRFDVPAFGLRNAPIGDVMLTARLALHGSTPDVVLRDGARRFSAQGRDVRRAENAWRWCLANGDLNAHLDLGRFLLNAGNAAAAFGHLQEATRLLPRCVEAWDLLDRAERALTPEAQPGAMTTQWLRARDMPT